MLKRDLTPDRQYLESVQGFQYGELLLDKASYGEVQSRVEASLNWTQGEHRIRDEALNHLLLGQSKLQDGKSNIDKIPKKDLDWAVNGLREARQVMYLPRALLARSKMFWNFGDFNEAEQDLKEAKSIATKYQMRLYEVDIYLEFSAMYQQQRQRQKAKHFLEKARKIINLTGYGRHTLVMDELNESLRSE
jgi:tetratricopeptide (TPR) repeat protein